MFVILTKNDQENKIHIIFPTNSLPDLQLHKITCHFISGMEKINQHDKKILTKINLSNQKNEIKEIKTESTDLHLNENDNEDSNKEKIIETEIQNTSSNNIYEIQNEYEDKIIETEKSNSH